ncbi:MAG: magnesium transporter [Phycisphaerales bacterium]
MSEAPRQPDEAALHALLEREDFAGAAASLLADHPGPDGARAFFATISTEHAARLISAVPDDAEARALVLWLPPGQAAEIVSAMAPAHAARLLASLPSDERADLLAALEPDPRGAIQALLPDAARSDAARLLRYEPGTAGGLMETEFLAYPAESTVADAIRDLRTNREKYAAIGVQYVYIVDAQRRFVGVAPIRDLMLAPEHATLRAIVRGEPVSVRDGATTHELASAFDEHSYIALPVVDERGTLLGVVNRADATEREHEEAEDDFRVSLGIVGGEELRSMPVLTRFRRRSAWLGVNLLLCLGGAAIVAMHQQTIAKVIIVAAVLPVVSASSGNAAMQAAAVSIRELTLGVIEPGAWRRVLVHELSLAALLAIPLGVALAFLSRLWGADWTVGAAVGAAMALNSLIAIALGALCPLVLRRLSIDPALASGPIATTLADVSGFAITLTFVSLAA